MFTDPAFATISSRVGVYSRRALICVLELVGRHDSLESVTLGQHESHPELVVVAILVGQDPFSPAPMATLVVVVVGEDEGILCVAESLISGIKSKLTWISERSYKSV